MARKQGGGATASFIGILILILICAYVGYTIFPAYYNAKEFQSALVNEGVRAGARSYSDENIAKEVILLAKSFEIALKAEDIKIRRMGDKIELTVEYDMPLEFSLVNYTYVWHFVAQTVSHKGMI